MSHVVIVGGGLAGLATAVALATHDIQVTILEARPRLGGRASSFTDPQSGQLIDTCQHVSMGCCTHFHRLCKTIGVRHFLEPQPKLYFQTPDRRISVFKADPWPAPLHLGRALAAAHYLTMTDKLRIAYGLSRMLLHSAEHDPPFLPWLKANGQNERTISRFWGVVLISALNESVDRIGLRYARKVFLDGFVKSREAFTVHVPSVPLARLYGEELKAWLSLHNVIVQSDAAVRDIALSVNGSGRHAVTLRNASMVLADAVVLAVPFDRVLALLPEALQKEPFFARMARFEASPITSIHIWTDRALIQHPHIVLVDGLGHWLFNRGEVAPGEHYLQVVISAAREFSLLGRDEMSARVLAELHQLIPSLTAHSVLRTKVVTERCATFSAVPGIDELRPLQRTPHRGLYLAGDYTQTGWPATMEGAVISGERAAAEVLRDLS